jgi:hypothetical protein
MQRLESTGKMKRGYKDMIKVDPREMVSEDGNIDLSDSGMCPGTSFC